MLRRFKPHTDATDRTTAPRILFGLGFLFPFFWIAGACLPCCSKAVNDRRAAIASGVALSAYTLLIVLLVVALPLSLNW